MFLAFDFGFSFNVYLLGALITGEPTNFPFSNENGIAVQCIRLHHPSELEGFYGRTKWYKKNMVHTQVIIANVVQEELHALE